MKEKNKETNLSPNFESKMIHTTLGSTHCVGSYTSGRLTFIDRISDDGSLPEKEAVLMPTMLSTTLRHIYGRVPNTLNSKLIADFQSYMIPLRDIKAII
jgi:hypothetical protein